MAFSTVSSSPSADYDCPNCSGQNIKTIDPTTGKCLACWPCTDCGDGSGLSVPCGATVPFGTKIHCVLCVSGANFSDSHSTDQCQPCGLCAGEHEHVLNKCTHESDVKCDCKEGFYRNKTNDKCHPCSSCPSCLRDEDIFSKCQKDGQTTPTSQATEEVRAINQNVHVNSMNGDHTHESKKTEIIITVLSVIVFVCLLIFACLLYHKLRNSRTRGAIEGDQENNGKGNSCETSSNRGSVPDLSSSLSGLSEDMFDRTVDSAQQDSRVKAGDHPDHTAAIEAQKGIPSSLEGELLTNLPKWPFLKILETFMQNKTKICRTL